MARFDFHKKKDVEKISRRIRNAYQKLSGGIGQPDDCVQEILCRMLEGRHQHSTIDQAVIDYLRSNYGGTGLRCNIAKSNLERADSFGPGDFERVLPMDIRGESSHRLDLDDCARYSGDQIDRACLKLVYRWGLSEAEVSNLFGFSESRVSQRIKRIQGRISARVKAKGSGEAFGKMAPLLRPEKERNLWGVGPITFERMEIGQSWQMASFDEKSF